jgi:hypothetical protein
VATTEVEAQPREHVERAAGDDASPRVWFIVLLVALVAVAPLLLWWGRGYWFFLDEWSFLVNRSVTDIPSMLEPHNAHWVTLPALAYRVDYRIFGLRSYLPYQMMAVLVHLGVIVMVWLTMRRLRVRPAIATITALPFVFYGAGAANILFAFQIALTASLVFGLGHLLLATADAPTLRRDVVGILLGLASIMCSGVGIPMVFGVALAVLIRRGWAAAALHAVPLGAIYLAWYAAYVLGQTDDSYSLSGRTVSFAWRMGKGAFVGLGQNGLVALALAMVAAIGIGWAVQIARADRHSAPPAIVAALVGSALSFALLTAFGRAGGDSIWVGPQTAEAGRYIYVVAALCLPVVALGAELLARRWIVLGAVPLVLLAIGLPKNIDLLREAPFMAPSEESVSAVGHSPLLAQLPPKTRLFPWRAVPELAPTAGFLRAAAASGRLPGLDHPSREERLNADAAIALHQTGRRTSRECPVATSPRTVQASRGTRIVFSGSVAITVRRGGVSSFPSLFESRSGNVVEVRAGPLNVTIAGRLGRHPAICRVESG